MKCLILAAGYATRLYPLTENFPKPLLEVGNKPILDWLIEDLQNSSDINEYIVVTNHKFAHHFMDWASAKNINITIVDDGTESNDTRLGAVNDIQYAIEKLDIKDDLLCMAGDNMLDFSLCGFLKFFEEKGSSCVMCHEENELAKQQKTAIITLDSTNQITSYEEKPKAPKGNLAVPPFYIYKKSDILRIKEALEQGCNGDAPGSFAAWLSHQTPMYAYTMPGKRYDIGDLNSYNAVKEIWKSRILPQ